MQLVNQTAVPCKVQVSPLDGTPHRFGFLTAKATFFTNDAGLVELDTQRPYPLFEKDVDSELGLLPADIVPRRDHAFEVIVLGSAHGRGRVAQMIEVAIGDWRRQLLVTGDRHWVRSGNQTVISPPARYEVLPLTWERAFGGAAPCWLDSESVMDLEHPMNKYGRGFDAEKLARDLGQAFKAPAGFPRLPPDHRRALPNLEDPAAPIRRWEDEPRPYCWATMPADIGARVQRAYDHMRDTRGGLTEQQMLDMVFHRAHPDCVIATPPAGAPVTLKGMTPEGTWSFSLPPLRVLADYDLGIRTGTRELEPHMLVLLAAEKRFYIVYRHFFTLGRDAARQRSFRIRVDERGQR